MNFRKFPRCVLEPGEKNWRTKANGFLSAITRLQFILTMITVMKCLSVLKPISIQLQKRDSDIYKAYIQFASWFCEIRSESYQRVDRGSL